MYVLEKNISFTPQLKSPLCLELQTHCDSSAVNQPSVEPMGFDHVLCSGLLLTSSGSSQE